MVISTKQLPCTIYWYWCKFVSFASFIGSYPCCFIRFEPLPTESNGSCANHACRNVLLLLTIYIYMNQASCKIVTQIWHVRSAIENGYYFFILVCFIHCCRRQHTNTNEHRMQIVCSFVIEFRLHNAQRLSFIHFFVCYVLLFFTIYVHMFCTLFCVHCSDE